jgi:hypothetical protein
MGIRLHPTEEAKPVKNVERCKTSENFEERKCNRGGCKNRFF